jgi:hypothetical protein
MLGRLLCKAVKRFCTATPRSHPKAEQLTEPYTLKIIGEKRFVEPNEIFTKIGECGKGQLIWRQYPLSKRK